MKRRIHWYVSATGWWWHEGRWTTVVAGSNTAKPRTKIGAFRCARQCSSPEVRIIGRYKDGRCHEWFIKR